MLSLRRGLTGSFLFILVLFIFQPALAVDLTDGWEYFRGYPHDFQAAHMSALEWRAMASRRMPTGQAHYLWVRIKLPAYSTPASFYIRGIETHVKVWLQGGELLYQHGTMPVSAPPKTILEKKAHLFSLPAHGSGQYLYFLTYSQNASIGLVGTPYLDTPQAQYLRVFMRDLDKIIVTSLIGFLGMIILGLSFNRIYRIHLWSGVFALAIALHLLGRMELMHLLWNWTLFWNTCEYSFFILAPAALALYFSQLISPPQFSGLPLIFYGQMGYGTLVFPIAFGAQLPISHVAGGAEFFAIFDLLFMTYALVYGVYTKKPWVNYFLIGFTGALPIVVLELLNSLNLIVWIPPLLHWGLLIFLSAIVAGSIDSLRVLYQQKIIAEELNRQKSLFLANMSHELRTPLNSIIGFTKVLIRKLGGEGSQFSTERLYLQRVESNSLHLLSLIDEILDLSKIEAQKMELFPEKIKISALLSEIQNNALPLMEKNKNNFELTATGSDDFDLYADKRRLTQILMNLISNAAKFTSAGLVQLKVACDLQRKIWTFSVQDTGIGIQAEDLKKLFQNFSQVDSELTRQYGGTGLGLKISQELARLMHGKIRVNSEYGKGSTFTLELPLFQAPTENQTRFS